MREIFSVFFVCSFLTAKSGSKRDFFFIVVVVVVLVVVLVVMLGTFRQ